MGPEYLEPLEATKGLVLLCHVPYVTLSGEQLVGSHLGSGAGQPPSIGSPELVFFCLGLG